MTIDYAPFVAEARKFASGSTPEERVYNAWPQKHRLLAEMCDRSAKHSAETHGDLNEASRELKFVKGLIDRVWHIGSSKNFQALQRVAGELAEDEAGIVATERERLWRRHDPLKAYREGFLSKDHFDGSQGELSEIIGLYISRPWLRHQVLDWVLLDMISTSEICVFGEHVKQTLYCDAGELDFSYIQVKGNLEKLSVRKNRFGWIITFIAECALFLCGWYILSLAPLGIKSPSRPSDFIILVALVAVSIVVMRFFNRKKLAQIAAARERPREILIAMHDVWKSLDGRALSPTRIREAMQKASNIGAVWDNSAWALIDRIIAIDHAVLSVRFDDECY